MKRFLSLAAACLSWVAFPAQAQIALVFNSYEPPTSGNYKIVKAWSEEVAKVTEGRVKIQIPPGSLARPEAQWEMVTAGVADGAYFLALRLPDALRLPQVATLPLAGKNAQAAAAALWRTHKKYFEQVNEYKDVVLLGYTAAPPLFLFSRQAKPAASLADLKGKPVLVIESQAKLFRDLGAVPIVGPSTTAHEQLSSGVVEMAAAMSYNVVEGFNLGRYLTSATEIQGGLVTALFAVVLNKGKWEQIPARDRELINSVSGENFARLSGVYWDQPEAEARERWIKAGKARTVAAGAFFEQIKKAAAPYEGEWLKRAASRGVDGKAALAYFRAEVKAAGSAPKK